MNDSWLMIRKIWKLQRRGTWKSQTPGLGARMSVCEPQQLFGAIILFLCPVWFLVSKTHFVWIIVVESWRSLRLNPFEEIRSNSQHMFNGSVRLMHHQAGSISAFIQLYVTNLNKFQIAAGFLIVGSSLWKRFIELSRPFKSPRRRSEREKRWESVRRGRDTGERKQMLWWRAKAERKGGGAKIGNGLDFWQMAPKAVRKSPEPPNLLSPTPNQSDEPSFSSHPSPLVHISSIPPFAVFSLSEKH